MDQKKQNAQNTQHMQSRVKDLVQDEKWIEAAQLMIKLDQQSYVFEDNLKINKRHGEDK